MHVLFFLYPPYYDSCNAKIKVCNVFKITFHFERPPFGAKKPIYSFWPFYTPTQSSTAPCALLLDEYIMQACNRACTLKCTRSPGKKRPLPWYDEECKTKRAQAIRAGHHVVTDSERQYLIQRCQEYRACKQRKKITFQRECVKRIEYAYDYDKSNLWPALNDISRDSRSEIPLSGDVSLPPFHVPSDSP